MSNYAESKKTLDKIRNEYGCKSDILFRSALQYAMEYGTDNLIDDWNYTHAVDDINNRHDAAEAEGKMLFVSRDFELAILECAREIANVNTYDLLMYVQKEVWLSGDGIDYQRAIELLKKLTYCLTEDYMPCNMDTLDVLYDIGMTDDEIESLGYGYLLDEEEE